MRRTILPLLAALGLSACAYDSYGYGPAGYGYEGGEWGGWQEDLTRLDPWLEDSEEGRVIVARAFGNNPLHPEAVRDLNIRFRFFADTNRDRRLTDREIRLALVRCVSHGWSW